MSDRDFEPAESDTWILLIEDNAGDVDLIRHSLSLYAPDCVLYVVSDGDRAIKFLDQLDQGEKPCPSLIVLDLNLPKSSGRDVLRRIRISPRAGSTRVIVFSSSEADKDKRDAALLGANRYITKPSNLDAFLKIGAILQEFLESR